jgi:hypothetical protein
MFWERLDLCIAQKLIYIRRRVKIPVVLYVPIEELVLSCFDMNNIKTMPTVHNEGRRTESRDF